MAMKMLFGYNFGRLSIAAIPQTQAKAEKEDWIDVDVTKLDQSVADAYEVYKEARAIANDLRKEFETKFKASVGYKDTPKVKPVQPKRSLAEYLAERRA